MGKEIVTVSKEEFLRYEEVRESGACNMISHEVEDLCDITKAQHIYIMSHYSELHDKYLGGTK